MINCQEATALMSSAEERRLGFADRLRLRLHLAICAACRNFGLQLGLIREAMRRFGRGGGVTDHAEPGDDDRV